MAKLKMVLTLPTAVDAEKFMAFVKTQTLGRYDDRRIGEYWLPTLELIGYRGYIKGNDKATYTVYECNAADFLPPFISVIDSLKNFGMLNYGFTLDGKKIALDWRPDGFEIDGYDYDNADNACDFWQAQIASLETNAKKIA